MTTHPQPPEGMTELVEAWRQAMQAIVDLGFTCHDEDFALDTDCPGWSVKDQFAHVAGIEAALDGVLDRRVEVPAYAHLTSDKARMVEHSVEVRRPLSGPQIVAEIQRLLPKRLAALNAVEDPEELLDSPLGPLPAHELAAQRTIDVWCHEQDIRVALDRPGNLDSPGAALFLAAVLWAFPRRAARQAGLPIGTVVILECTGPVTARQGVRIVEGENGKLFGESLFSGEAAGHPVDGSVTTIRLTTESLTRLGAGRKSPQDVPFTVDGDAQVAERVLAALSVTP